MRDIDATLLSTHYLLENTVIGSLRQQQVSIATKQENLKKQFLKNKTEESFQKSPRKFSLEFFDSEGEVNYSNQMEAVQFESQVETKVSIANYLLGLAEKFTECANMIQRKKGSIEAIAFQKRVISFPLFFF